MFACVIRVTCEIGRYYFRFRVKFLSEIKKRVFDLQNINRSCPNFFLNKLVLIRLITDLMMIALYPNLTFIVESILNLSYNDVRNDKKMIKKQMGVLLSYKKKFWAKNAIFYRSICIRAPFLFIHMNFIGWKCSV